MIKKYSTPRRYIKSLELHNYKGFKEKTSINLAPKINLIFGKNSTGKSSVFQSLRLFRQSYDNDDLTPISFDIPEKYRGRGGLDLEINYQGIINNLDLKKKLSLGVGTSIFSEKTPKSSDPDKDYYCNLVYTYKYESNFYSKKYLPKNVNLDVVVKQKTILDSLKIEKGNRKTKINFPNYVIFKEGSSVDKSILKLFRQSFLNEDEGKKSEFKSLYSPYYYNVEIDKESIPTDYIIDSFSKLQKIRQHAIKYLQNVVKYLDDTPKKKPNTSGRYVNFKKINDLKTKLRKFETKNKNTKDYSLKRIKWMINNKDIVELFIQSIMKERFQYTTNHFIIIRNDINEILNAFKKNKLNNKNSFLKFFSDDIIIKSKNLIFYKNTFHLSPFAKKKYILPLKDNEFFNRFTEPESRFNYLFNIISETISDKEQISFFENYEGRSFRPELGDSVKSNIKKCMDKMYIMPGLRTLPKRYYVKGLQTNYVGPQAENLAEFLANTDRRKITNEWLTKLEIPYSVDVKKVNNYYEIVFIPKNSKSKLEISQTHVGLGFPLIMPFIVQCITSKNEILVAEEPEVHLHPKLESDLADLLVWSSNTRGNQFIIETHSEDFLLRLLKHVRKKNIKPNEISANYMTNINNEGSKVRKININIHGQYSVDWKDNMFTERINEFK